MALPTPPHPQPLITLGVGHPRRQPRRRRAPPAQPHACTRTTPTGAAKLAPRSVARRWLQLAQEITHLELYLGRLVAKVAPALVAVKGVRSPPPPERLPGIGSAVVQPRGELGAVADRDRADGLAWTDPPCQDSSLRQALQ